MECAERLNILDYLVFHASFSHGRRAGPPRGNLSCIFDGIFANDIDEKRRRSAQHLCSCDLSLPDASYLASAVISKERCEQASLQCFEWIMRPKIDDSTALLGLRGQKLTTVSGFGAKGPWPALAGLGQPWAALGRLGWP